MIARTHPRVQRMIMGALSPRAIAGMEPDLIAWWTGCWGIAGKGS